MAKSFLEAYNELTIEDWDSIIDSSIQKQIQAALADREYMLTVQLSLHKKLGQVKSEWRDTMQDTKENLATAMLENGLSPDKWTINEMTSFENGEMLYSCWPVNISLNSDENTEFD